MRSFRSVNPPKSPEPAKDEMATTSPKTPPSKNATSPQLTHAAADDATTPTRDSFHASGLASQKPLPSSPFPDLIQIPGPAEAKTPTRENSQRSRKSRDSEDMDMDQSDGENAASSPESTNPDETGSTKKKKSQRFYCQGYPGCNLSFTRSEHLARHIRKHTGERPFQCHCQRRFSRLDNLRQHAQTVHQNEDIPDGSPAATGARYQRQVRTDRVRPPGGRARASTAGSTGPSARGHSKSLSTSSIASIGPSRPQLIIVPSDRARYSFESVRGVPDGHAQLTSSEFGTPTSATFPSGQNSPRWAHGLDSPVTSHSRSQSLYYTTPARRLSVPSGTAPFREYPTEPLSPSFANYGSGNSSLITSPTSSTFFSRRESLSSAADDPTRRRTWHPDMRDHNGASRLSQVLNTSDFSPSPVPPPLANPGLQQSQQTQRLPGIESFDSLLRRQPSPTRRIPSPMAVDSDPASLPHLLPAPDMVSENRQTPPSTSWDAGLHRGIRRLDLNNHRHDSAAAWGSEANQAVLAQAEQVRATHAQPTVRFEPEVHSAQAPLSGRGPMRRHHQYTMSAPSGNAFRDTRRHGFYGGPTPAIHQAPETIHESRPYLDRPSERIDRIAHPNLHEFQFRGNSQTLHQAPNGLSEQHRLTESLAMKGFQNYPAHESLPEGRQLPVRPRMEQGDSEPRHEDRRALDYLVAVATSEASTASAYERSNGSAVDREKQQGYFPIPNGNTPNPGRLDIQSGWRDNVQNCYR